MAAAGPVTSSGTVLEKEACMQPQFPTPWPCCSCRKSGPYGAAVAVANSSPPPLPRVPL
ncbi:hypothetical protein FQN60_007693 [Etheostoma spectabile]|uniref:Uncharacterized protein n=1 Tax=Etheostoma spectabile TaxID=54343 RepID=A0A5J5CY93_9PERO|nr:hypothetical protein FQN60_007693 [Etheostoma spectabile]